MYACSLNHSVSCSVVFSTILFVVGSFINSLDSSFLFMCQRTKRAWHSSKFLKRKSGSRLNSSIRGGLDSSSNYEIATILFSVKHSAPTTKLGAPNIVKVKIRFLLSELTYIFKFCPVEIDCYDSTKTDLTIV